MNLSHEEKWARCVEIFRDNLPQEQFEAWFEPITSLEWKENRLTVLVPSSFFVEQLEMRYMRLLSSAIQREYGSDVKLYYRYNQVSNEPSTGVTTRSSNPSPDVQPKAGASSNPFDQVETHEIDAQLNPTYTFENYCGSASNRLARSIGEAIAKNPNCKTYNPLFIFGQPGVGKTHLIQAIGIKIKERTPQTRVLYVTARLFESQFTTAVRKGRINDFINFYQSIDTLIIDDIQDLIGKTATQNTFYHIFDHLLRNQKQLVLASDCCPSMMEGMEQRLLSRFKWGMTAELDKPDFELRRDVLRLKAEQNGLDLPDEIIDYIAGNVKESVRELEGIVVSLIAHATVFNQDISLELTRKVMANAVKMTRKQISFDMIIQSVADYYSISPEQIFSKSRKREISDARQMVMFMSKKHAGMAYTAIGSRLARTHATVLYACKSIEERLTLEKQLQADVAKIENELLSNQ